MNIVNRRTMVAGALATAGAYGLVRVSGLFDQANARPGGPFKVNHSPEEWKRRLGADRYRILRLAGTERAYSSPLNSEKRKGVFACAGCDLGVYHSAQKYDSGTGWPSFWAAIRAPKSIAPVAAGIWAIFSMMDRNRPASAIASTAWPSNSFRPDPGNQPFGASICCQNSSLIPSQSRIQANLP